MSAKSKISSKILPGGGTKASKAADISKQVIQILKKNPSLQPIVKKRALKKTENSTLTRVANKNNIDRAVLKSEGKKIMNAGGPEQVERAAGAGKFKPDPNYKAPKPISDKGSTKGLTKAEKRERAALLRQIEKEGATEQAHGAGKKIEQTVRGRRPGLGRPDIIESPSGRLKSKQKVDQTGWTKGEKFKQKLQPHADPADVVYGQMTGQELTRSHAEDIKDLIKSGDLNVKKYGGKVKRNMGGPVRGVGAATRGFGKAKYSSKLY